MKTTILAVILCCSGLSAAAATATYDVTLPASAFSGTAGFAGGTFSITGFFTVDESAGNTDGLVGSAFTDPGDGGSFATFDELTAWSFSITGSGGAPSFTISSTDAGAADTADTLFLTGSFDNRVGIGGGFSADSFDFRVTTGGVTAGVQFRLSDARTTVFSGDFSDNSSILANGPGPTITWRDPGTGGPSKVPLPASALLLAAALGLLAARRRRP